MSSEQYKNLEQWIKSIDKKLDNHLVHTAADISFIKSDINWLKKVFSVVATAVVTGIIGGVIAFIFK